MTNPTCSRPGSPGRAAPLFAVLLSFLPLVAIAQVPVPTVSTDDPRVGLQPGWTNAGEAASNLRLIAHRDRPQGFFNPDSPGDGAFSNTDLAFKDQLVFVGNYHGFTVYDISDPSNPRLRVSVVCPGGQGDLSVHGDLLFMSVQETRSRIDCGTQGAPDSVNVDRFRGVRIFDIGDIETPRQVAAIQTCRGSHTHTILTHPDDPENVYVYVSGTSESRPAGELAGCSRVAELGDPNTPYWRIEVIQVPLDAPQDARIVNMPRLFADPATGTLEGLWAGGDHGPGTQTTNRTIQCHDITAYPEIGLAGGACSGNGILIDISDPANPQRIDEVVDPNFAYWHSATFNNDGRTVLFTDEWGGGVQAFCRASDPSNWGANAIFVLENEEMRLASYYKLPVAQTETENCVAHNGSLIPVPGRDIMVQAWYQGGVSVFDFSDPYRPYEIAYFDRGPVSASELLTGGYWSTYWYNGHIYGSEITRGLDVFELQPSEHLTENEIEAARLVQYEELNPQDQPRVTWPASPVVARAYLDQLGRTAGIGADRGTFVTYNLDRVERLPDGVERRAARADLTRLAGLLEDDAAAAEVAGRGLDARRLGALAEVLRELGEG